MKDLNFHSEELGLETVVTRVGCNTHLVLCGDSDQSDLKYNEAHEHKKVIDTLQSMPDFRTYTFGIDDIVRSEFVKRYYEAKQGVVGQDSLDHILSDKRSLSEEHAIVGR